MTTRPGRWLGVPARVALANAASVFRSASPPDAEYDTPVGGHEALSRRAGAVLRGSGIVVAYEGATAAPSQSRHTTVLVPWRSGDLCVDLADDGAAMDGLRRACTEFPLPWVLWAQVFSPSADTLTLDLGRREFDRSVLPRCSGMTVAYWNTKVGGSELLRRALPDSPATTTCSSTADVHLHLARSPAARWVVKPDHGLGGHGVVVVDASLDLEALMERLTSARSTPASPTKKGGGKSSVPAIATRFVVQPVIGDPETNVSPTVDFWVAPNGAVRAAGFADQVLDASVRYVGSRTSAAGPEVRRRIVDAGAKVGRELYRNGYVGLFNLDAVCSAEGEVSVVEINVRQSAPLDQSLTMSRVYGRSSDAELTHTFQAYEPGHGTVADTLDGGRLYAYGASAHDNGLTMAVTPRAISGR